MPQKTSLSKPHDRLFRSIMQEPQVARDFFEAALPEDVRQSVDLSTLKLQKESFIDEDLKEHIADLVFQVKVQGKTGYFHILAEHQSTPQWDMPFRLLKYMIALQDHHLKHHKTKTLPFVYPLLLYAGEKKYPYTMDFFELFGDNEEHARELFQKPFQMVDLTQVPEEDLDQYRWFGPLAFVMKEIRHLDTCLLAEAFVRKTTKFEIYDTSWYLEGVVRYMFEAGETQDRKKLIQILSRGLTSVSKEDIMTIADQFRQEGREQGMQKGMQQGMQQGMQEGMQQGSYAKSQEIAQAMMSQNMSLATISDLTGLSLRELKKLQAMRH